MHRRIVPLAWMLLACLCSSAQAETREIITAEAFLASLEFRTGTVELPGGVATVTLPDGYHYLSPEDTERVLVSAWGNPPGNETLGMILGGPEDVLAERSWAAVIAFERDGYVPDEDAVRVDYRELLADMQADSRSSNDSRMDAGYEDVELVGWATRPRYDGATNTLYWAKELRFGSITPNTLNYNVRILGRRGVLVLNVVATMPQLEEIETVIPRIVSMTRFNPGHRYADFDPSADRVAAYGIAALVAGKVASRTGLLAKLGALLPALKEFWILIPIVIGAGLAGVFRRGRARPTPAAP